MFSIVLKSSNYNTQNKSSVMKYNYSSTSLLLPFISEISSCSCTSAQFKMEGKDGTQIYRDTTEAGG